MVTSVASSGLGLAPRRRASLALVLLFALASLAPTATSQLPSTPLDPILAEAQKNATSMRNDTVGPELRREDVDVDITMEFRDVDFDTINVIFGGGKFSANARISARIDLRVLAAARVQGALEGVAPGSSNLTGAMGAGHAFIAADTFRATLAGEALAAFQGEQEEKLADYIRETIPNVTVMGTQFVWTNVSPQDSLETRGNLPTGAPEGIGELNDLTYPPITLNAVVDVQYLERTSLLGIVDKALSERKSDREKEREAEVADAEAAYERSAFGLLGIRQVLDLQAPEGWDLEVRVTLPDGFTFEEASPDVALTEDLRHAQVLTLGREASDPVLNPVALTLSNRFIVSTAMLATVLLLGSILRFPVQLATNALRRRLREERPL